MNPLAATHSVLSASLSRSRPASSGLNTAGPRIAPNTEPKSTSAMPRARRSGGYMSPAAVRASSPVAVAVPTRISPASTARAHPCAVPSAASRHPAMPQPKPPARIGTRPMRSISSPAGSAASAPAASTIAGPRPSRPSMSSTLTSVSDATAADSCSVAEFIACELDSSAVLRPIGSWLTEARLTTSRASKRRRGRCASGPFDPCLCARSSSARCCAYGRTQVYSSDVTLRNVPPPPVQMRSACARRCFLIGTPTNRQL